MAEKLGEAYVELVGLDKGLSQSLNSASSHLRLVTNNFNSMAVASTKSSGIFDQAVKSMMNSTVAFGGNTKKATTLSKTMFTTLALGAAAAVAGFIATTDQGKRLGDALGAIGQVAIDKTIGPALDHISHAISSLATNIKNFGFAEGFERTFSEQTKIGIVAVAGAIMGVMIPAINALRINLMTLIPQIWAAVAPLLPFILIGAAVAVVAYLIWQNWSTITQWLQTAWNALWQGAVSIFNGIYQAIVNAWHWIVNTTLSIWNGIVNFFKQWGMTLLVVLLPGIGFLIATIINNWGKIKAATLAAWNAVKSFLTSVWASIKNAVSPYFQAVVQFVQSAWSKAKSITSSLWNGLKSWLSSVWSSIKSTASSVWTSVTSAIANAWNSLKSKASSIWSGIYNAIAGWINKALSAIQPFVRGFNSMVSKVNSLTGARIPTISVPTHLAKGGIVTAPTMALVGEGRYHEAVLPLSNDTFQSLADGITSNMSGGRSTTINVYPTKANINERDLANILRRTEWMLGV